MYSLESLSLDIHALHVPWSSELFVRNIYKYIYIYMYIQFVHTYIYIYMYLTLSSLARTLESVALVPERMSFEPYRLE